MHKKLLIGFALCAFLACKNESTPSNQDASTQSTSTSTPKEVAPPPLTDPKIEEYRVEGKKRLDKVTSLMDQIDALPASARLDRDLQLMRNALAGALGKSQSAYQELVNVTKEDRVDAAGTAINSAKLAQDALESLTRLDPFLSEIQTKVDSFKK